MKLTIKTLKGEQFDVMAESTDTVLQLKQKVQDIKNDHAAERQKLIHAGKVLKDAATIGEVGVSENDFIVCMLSKEVAKPKPAPAAAVPTPPVMTTPAAAEVRPPAAPVAASTPAATSTPAQPTYGTTTTPAAAPAPVINPEALAQLTAMGFPEDECRAALTAAQGNPDLAANFLMEGIPASAMAPAAAPTAAPAAAIPADSLASLETFRQHPQFNQLKQLVQTNPAAVSQVMDAIGRQNPTLLEAIHANHDAFIAMMNEPIVDTPPPVTPAAAPAPAAVAAPAAGMPAMPAMGGMLGATGGQPNPAQIMQMLSMLPPEQRNQLAASMGMNSEQLNGVMQMMQSMPPEQLAQMTAQMGAGGMPGMGGADGEVGNVVRLTEEELASVNRLMELGFSQQEAAQAFLACDKNEALAANLLLEGGWADGSDEGGYEDFGGDFGGMDDGGNA